MRAECAETTTDLIAMSGFGGQRRLLRRSDASYQMSEENLTLGATVASAATDPIRRVTRRSRPENYAACRRVISAKTACPSSVNE
jgi:hypothetical protein